MNPIFYTTERDKAQFEGKSDIKIAIELDYAYEDQYQIDVWPFGFNFSEEEREDSHLFSGGVFNHPIMFLRFGNQIIEHIRKHYPQADIVIIDSVTDQGIRNPLDIQAKYDARKLAGLE